MAEVRVVGEGGAEFVLDDETPYVAEQLANGQLRRVDPVDCGGQPAKRPRRSRPTAVPDPGS